MRQRTVLVLLRSSLLALLYLSYGLAVAQTTSQSVAESSTSPFELKNGDRVVFLGNSLFENDFQYGYLELALTTRWPDRDVTYRNLGWTGDNVFGVARGSITNPPTAYELLMEHLTKAQPTVVFLAYGGIEAQDGDGEAGLPTFKEGLTKLLDKIDQLGAKAILLSPIPILSADSAQSLTQRNAMLELYAATIAKTATERSTRYIDIFKPIQEINRKGVLTENGIHLNETGYYYLSTILEKGLGLPPRTEPVAITISKATVEAAAPAKMLDSGANSASFKFTINERYLPLPMADSGRTISGQIVKIAGLKKGFYKLTADNSEVITASANQWAEGVEIRQGPSFEQVHALRQMILKKNELFFFQYRPMNTTYILGMRAHEQGRHVKGLEEQSIIIKWLEGQIAVNRAPVSRVYQLTLLK